MSRSDFIIYKQARRRKIFEKRCSKKWVI